MEEEQRLQLSCQVCLCQYDSQDHRPLLLPACGHTFCAFCVEHLEKQGKRFCPKCRKDGAVQPVSSLPVNYSLLDVVQNISCEGAAAIRPNPSSAHRTTGTSGLPTTKLHHQYHKIRQNNSQIPSRINNANHPNPANGFFQRHLRRAAVNPPISRGLTIPTPATRTLGAHNPNPTHTAFEREQQDELDFQMAVHLTFCKDESHDHNLHTSCSSWDWQDPEDEDLSTILAHIQSDAVAESTPFTA